MLSFYNMDIWLSYKFKKIKKVTHCWLTKSIYKLKKKRKRNRKKRVTHEKIPYSTGLIDIYRIRNPLNTIFRL